MRFFLDQAVPVSVQKMLRAAGHECWTAAEAGLFAAADDDLSVYADAKHAALITLDKEFSLRRLRNPIGHHVWLRCPEPKAADVLRMHLVEVLDLLRRDHVAILVAEAHVSARSRSV